MATPAVRTGQGDVKLSREEFERRLRERFSDPGFDAIPHGVQDVVDVAWKAYDEYHKSPRTRKAGPGFADLMIGICPDHLETELGKNARRCVLRRHGLRIKLDAR